jgi:hypothetical protein
MRPVAFHEFLRRCRTGGHHCHPDLAFYGDDAIHDVKLLIQTHVAQLVVYPAQLNIVLRRDANRSAKSTAAIWEKLLGTPRERGERHRI